MMNTGKLSKLMETKKERVMQFKKECEERNMSPIQLMIEKNKEYKRNKYIKKKSE